MDSIVLLSFRIGLLVLLWFFIFMAIRALYRDTQRAAGPAGAPMAAPSSPTGPKGSPQPGRITIVQGPLKGSHLDISHLDDVLIGRTPDCTFVVGDDYASSRHARLFKRGAEWFVEDLDSRNGTFVGGFRIDQPERVSTGSDIRIGRTTVRLVP